VFGREARRCRRLKRIECASGPGRSGGARIRLRRRGARELGRSYDTLVVFGGDTADGNAALAVDELEPLGELLPACRSHPAGSLRLVTKAGASAPISGTTAKAAYA